jgi:hypothetical protein
MEHANSINRADAPATGHPRSPDSGDASRALPRIDRRLPPEFELVGTNRLFQRVCDDGEPKGRKRGLWRGVRYLLGGLISPVGVDEITEGASIIRGFAQRIKAGLNSDTRIRIFDDRTLDLETMAYNAGVSVAEVRVMLANRRRQTRRAVKFYMTGAIGFFCLWVWQASATAAYARLAYVVLLVLICGLFCLSAFYNALVNWQCRTERLGTWGEFLTADESWWPS